MESPSDQLRDLVLSELSRLPPPDERVRVIDDTVEKLLSTIDAELATTVETSEQLARLAERIRNVGTRREWTGEDVSAAEDILATVHEWAGLTSYVLASIYGPSSPLPRNLAGWGKTATARLQQVTKTLLTPLRVAATVTAAGSWSISVGFPWGISIGLSWP